MTQLDKRGTKGERDHVREHQLYHHFGVWELRKHLESGVMCAECGYRIPYGWNHWASMATLNGNNIWLHSHCYAKVCQEDWEEIIDIEDDDTQTTLLPKPQENNIIDYSDRKLFTDGQNTQDGGVWLVDIEELCEKVEEFEHELIKIAPGLFINNPALRDLYNRITTKATTLNRACGFIRKRIENQRGNRHHHNYGGRTCLSRPAAFQCGDCKAEVCYDNLCVKHEQILEHFATTGHRVNRAVDEERKAKNVPQVA